MGSTGLLPGSGGGGGGNFSVAFVGVSLASSWVLQLVNAVVLIRTTMNIILYILFHRGYWRIAYFSAVDDRKVNRVPILCRLPGRCNSGLRVGNVEYRCDTSVVR